MKDYIKNNKNNIISIILSIIMVLFTYHNFRVSGNNIIFIFIFVVLYFFFKEILNKIFQSKEKRKNIVAIIISTFFAITEVLCISINNDYTLNNVFNKWLILNFLGYFIIAYILVMFFYNKIENVKIFDKKCNILKNNEILITILCIGIIFISWIPYFMTFYPGIISPDSYSQIQQVLGNLKLEDHHPILHTAIIGMWIKLGLSIFKDINIAISLYTISQMLILSIFYSYVIRFLRRKNVNKVVIIATLVFYMIYPIHAVYSTIMWKDILFSGIFPIFVIMCFEIVFNTEEFLKKGKNILLFIIISLLTIYLRHNGLYVVIITLVGIIIMIKKYRKKLLLLFITIIILFEFINFMIYNVLKVTKGSIAEAMSIPLQQIARSIKNNENEIDEGIKEGVNCFFEKENIWYDYEPTLSDNVKFKFNVNYFKDNKIEFIKIWIKLFITYPKDYIEAVIANSYGYYYPEAENSVLGIYNVDNKHEIIQKPEENNKVYEVFVKIVQKRNIPIISMMFSIGFEFWIILTCLGYKIYKKEYNYILIYIPILILWLTCVASPVYNEFRYAYPIFTTLPIYISLNFIQNKEILGKSNMKK